MQKNLPERFKLRIPVKDSDIDPLGHVNNTVYLRWVQDAAVAHWRLAAAEAWKENILWVVTRHEIDYKCSAHLEDEIIAETWVGKATDFIFERHTEIIREKDNKLLAKAKTFWCPINRVSGKPMRVDSDVRNRFSVKE